MSRYLKSITALFTGVVGWGAFVVASPSAAVTAPEWIMLAVAVGTALGVLAVPNTQPLAPPSTIYQSFGTDGGNGGTTTTNPAVTLAADPYFNYTATATTVPSEPAAKPPPPVKPVEKTAKKAAPRKDAPK